MVWEGHTFKTVAEIRTLNGLWTRLKKHKIPQDGAPKMLPFLGLNSMVYDRYNEL